MRLAVPVDRPHSAPSLPHQPTPPCHPPAGKAGARLKEDDAMDDVVYVNDHDTLLFFTTEVRGGAAGCWPWRDVGRRG